jgi:hypothetical protein
MEKEFIERTDIAGNFVYTTKTGEVITNQKTEESIPMNNIDNADMSFKPSPHLIPVPVETMEAFFNLVNNRVQGSINDLVKNALDKSKLVDSIDRSDLIEKIDIEDLTSDIVDIIRMNYNADEFIDMDDVVRHVKSEFEGDDIIDLDSQLETKLDEYHSVMKDRGYEYLCSLGRSAYNAITATFNTEEFSEVVIAVVREAIINGTITIEKPVIAINQSQEMTFTLDDVRKVMTELQYGEYLTGHMLEQLAKSKTENPGGN